MQIIDTSAIDSLDIPYEQKEVLRGQLVASFKADQSALNKEFSRYKQDCRKRALDLAADLMRNKPVTEDEQMLKIATKYYKWLIEIPS